MQKVNDTWKLFRATALVIAAVTVLVLSPSAPVCSAEEGSYAERAMRDAEKARAEAEKAMMEAEKAIEEAEKAMTEAERAKAIAKKEKAKAMEKMVGAGYFPEDFSMSVPESTVTAVFSHKKHTEREQLRCMECHPKVFIMKVGKDVVKRGHLNMEEMKKGKYCGNCHNGHKAFSVTSINHCKRCHPKQ